MVSNRELAALFDELASLLKVADGNAQSFKARAYETAARTLDTLEPPASEMPVTELIKLKGIGKSSASKIKEIVETGTMDRLIKLREEFPPTFLDLVRVPGLGPKTALMIRERLDIEDIDGLRDAIVNEKLRELPGLGAKTEEKLAKALDRLGTSGKDRRTPILDAMAMASRIIDELKPMAEVERIQYCGSLRRFRDTVADVDILVAAADPAPVTERFSTLAFVTEVIGSGSTKTSVITQGGLQVDLRVVEPAQWGAAILYFTGSKAHNIRLRRLAIQRGWLLNEYALAESEGGAVVASETEEEIYDALDLPWIPPAVREDTGEIEFGLDRSLPAFVRWEDLRGDLHVHTSMSGDGDHSLTEMLDAAVRRGLEYLALTDHAEDLAMNGVDQDAMLEQRGIIGSMAANYPTLTILHGAELNIGKDGGVDYDPEFLSTFDWGVASVHSLFDLDIEAQTTRVITAMQNPAVNVIGHLFGRRIGKRPGIELIDEAVIEAAALTGTAIEINSHLDRLDAPSEFLRKAMSNPDVMFVISTDSHRTGELWQSRFGVTHAQRGWVTADRVANTWPVDRFVEWAANQRVG